MMFRTSSTRKLTASLARCFEPDRTVSRAHVDAAANRVLYRLTTEPMWDSGAPLFKTDAARELRPVRLIAAVATAAILIVVVSSTPWRGADSPGRVEAADGSLYSVAGNTQRSLRQGDSIGLNEVLRSNGGAGAMLALADGSRIEMRSQSELSLERADDGVRIRLQTGGIIVNAAKQRSGHLYVQTKDMTVSVVGTVFVVNAAEDGSRVAVIEGEVRVHEGNTETKLRPGEHVSTNAAREARSVAEEIAWSRRVAAHLALLQQAVPQSLPPTPDTSATVQTQPAPVRSQFEEASIRSCDPDNLPPLPAGARGGGANTFQMTPGRTHVSCMTLATIIRTAYGYGPADLDFRTGGRAALRLDGVYGLGAEDGVRVRGGPDWVRSERYTIDAIADPSADASTMQRGMLQTLLERRFQLKAHIEVEQVPAFALTVAKSGLKMKPMEEGGCTPLPSFAPGERVPPARTLAEVRRGEKPTCGIGGERNGPNVVLIGGGARMSDLVRSLGSRLGSVHVFDKTGVTSGFNILLEFVLDENTPDRFGRPPVLEPSDIPRGPTIFVALEEQLGLKLEPARAPREFIVIDQVERPAAN